MSSSRFSFYRFLPVVVIVSLMAGAAFAQKSTTPATPVPAVAVSAEPAPMPAGNTPSFAPASTKINNEPVAEGAAAPAIASQGKDSVVDIITAETPEAPVDEAVTHPPLKLTPDKSELVKLDGEAASIILGNPNHVSILADSSRTLVLVPRAPGATYFTVLDKKGNVLMQRHVIVAAPQEKYVRIRRSCNSNANCQPTQVYYCPDMCHEIIMGGEMNQNASAQSPVANEGGGGTPESTGIPEEPPAPEPAPADTTDSAEE